MCSNFGARMPPPCSSSCLLTSHPRVYRHAHHPWCPCSDRPGAIYLPSWVGASPLVFLGVAFCLSVSALHACIYTDMSTMYPPPPPPMRLMFQQHLARGLHSLCGEGVIQCGALSLAVALLLSLCLSISSCGRGRRVHASLLPMLSLSLCALSQSVRTLSPPPHPLSHALSLLTISRGGRGT